MLTSDVPGEAIWIKRMVDRHHATAAAKCIKIVHSCAYDSIPADLGTLLVVEYMHRVHGKCAHTTDTYSSTLGHLQACHLCLIHILI